jgi:hypothetical protein
VKKLLINFENTTGDKNVVSVLAVADSDLIFRKVLKSFKSLGVKYGR